MTRAELAQYKKILEDQQAELEALLRHRDGISIERSADALDEIQHAAQRELAVRNLDRETTLLRNVQAALSRIRDNTFGVCVRCEDGISPKRLTAATWTPYCIHCQEVVDRDRERGWTKRAA